MPLILLCGQPCSGKSAVTAQVAQLLRDKGLQVVIINEESVGLERNACYRDARSEKETRGLLKATVDRTLRGDVVVILDSLNNIKGYRYELWCIARAASTKYCVVYCEVPTATCREWNSFRQESGYTAAVFEDLASRFEAPDDARNRWDRPLFRLDPTQEAACTSDCLREVVVAILGKGVASRGTPVVTALQPNVATSNPEQMSTNLLHELDRATQDVVSAITEAQARAGGEAAGPLEMEGVPAEALVLRRPVTLPELRRHKRSFLKLATQNSFSRVRGAETAKQMFVEYLQDSIVQ